MNRTWLLIPLCAVLILAACGGESTVQKVDSPAPSAQSEQSESAAENEPAAAEPPSPEKQEPETLTLGDTVKFDELLITLNGVRTSEGEEFFSPNNDFFLILDITIENTGDKAEIISSMLQMSLYDADAYSYNQMFLMDLKGSVDGEVAPGRKMRGELAFDVPASEYYEFVFEKPFTTGQAIWKFEVE